MSAGDRQQPADGVFPEYLNVAEAAHLVRVSPRTLRNKMATGVVRLGTHYFRTPGLGPRFKRSALEAWIEGRESVAASGSPLDDIPMARRGLNRSRRQA